MSWVNACSIYKFLLAQGKKTRGRTAGTPNKRTADLTARLELLGIDPLAGLAQIASDPETSLELRAKVHCELMAYLYPKKPSIDVSTAQTQPFLFGRHPHESAKLQPASPLH
jgi:hypothetical protein